MQTDQLTTNNVNQTEQVLQTLNEAVADKKLFGGDLTVAANAMKTINNVSASVTISSLEVSIVRSKFISPTITII